MSKCKSVLDTYTLTDVTVATNGLLPLEQNYLLTGCAIVHSPGSTTITLQEPGLYLVNFDAEGSTAGGTGGFTAQLYNNGVVVPGATSTSGATSTTDIETIGFSKVIQVKPSCCAIDNTANLTFVSTGADSIYTSITVNVVKL